LPRWAVLLLVVSAVAGCGVAGAAAAATSKRKHQKTATKVPGPVPQGFVGMDTDGPLLATGTTVNLDNQLGTMVASGVQSIRVAFSWSSAQPYASYSQVPAGQTGPFADVAGRPTDFRFTDAVVGAAARHRLLVLPTVLYTPPWDARASANPHGFAMPAQTAPYAAYLTALIGRYGPTGSFWRQNPSIPKVPIRAWQIWNEPNISRYWDQPFAASYTTLLRAAHAAIKHADPGAQVVLGALTNAAWSSLHSIYRVRGARSQFDVVSVNAFTKLPANVIVYLRYVRSMMQRYGDAHKPLIATEVSWPSGAGVDTQSYDFDTTQTGQARNIAALLPLIGRDRLTLGLSGFDYYTWMGDETPGNPAFDFAGLMSFRNGQVAAKPALAAFRTGVLALEGCRAKGAVATSCIR
jgi:hypothetical protein